ncbi:hypothetical protein Spp001_60 [Shewanella phage Spp001]|uniref:Uncharacterized protein n=1 Tax=Shewanella phage Spp001 TaxID=1445859 RepID=W6E8A6_9CAUD|nr:hypothetical protein Spp001_60 [Shewanella phage Spp001]AHJ10568.1 hypothetical protein Spp001_60 [Shewanella phage Spp001]
MSTFAIAIINAESLVIGQAYKIAKTDLNCYNVTVGNRRVMMPSHYFQDLITTEEKDMKELLESLLIACIDSETIDVDVARHINETATSEEHLEELLIACVDSGTVSEDVAMHILNTINA